MLKHLYETMHANCNSNYTSYLPINDSSEKKFYSLITNRVLVILNFFLYLNPYIN